MTQPMPTMIPPNAITGFGPIVSAIQPSMGVSQVSKAMKIAKATWIAVRVQPCALLIGLTKSVQPYCRLAIMTMQMTHKIRLTHRVESETRAVAPDPVAVAIFILPKIFG